MSFVRSLFSYTIVRFIISGSTAALFYFAMLYTFTDIFGLWYLLSSIIAYISSFSLSFVLQKFLTFRDSRMDGHIIQKQLIRYLILAFGMFLSHTALLFILVDIVGLWYLFAATVDAAILGVLSFFLYRIFIFNVIHHGSILKTSAILIATGLYPPDIGGPATYSKLLEEELPKYGLAPVVVSFGTVRQLPKLIRHFIYFLKVIVKSETVQVVYAQDPVSVGLPALLAARILGKKYILKIVGDYAWEQFQQRKALLKQFPISGFDKFDKLTAGKLTASSKSRGNFQFSNKELVTLEDFQNKKFDFITEMRRRVERFVARHADAIVVPSNYLKKIILEWGVSPEKIKVIYNSFDVPVNMVNKKGIRNKLGINGTLLVSAGRLVPWKGFEALIEVISELKKNIPDIKLYIAGDGPQEKDLRFKIKDLRMENIIILLGRLAHDKLVEYVQAADIFVLNTGYEGFSHQLLEVMALGTPIITTHVGGNPELVENLKTGLLVSYNNKSEIKTAIELLMRDAELRERFVQSGKEKVKLFSKEQMLRSLIEIF